jgi:hypothetical protein
LAAFCLVAVFWLPPRRPVKQPLEYESVVRETQELAERFPARNGCSSLLSNSCRKRLAWEGASFVEEYQGRVGVPEFRFPEPQEDLFIYLEKTPFQIFTREPSVVSFPVLTDITYRNYRSPAGRASLESAAMQLCESYRRHHSDADIYFEDDCVRIYHIHQQTTMNTKAGPSHSSGEK